MLGGISKIEIKESTAKSIAEAMINGVKNSYSDQWVRDVLIPDIQEFIDDDLGLEGFDIKNAENLMSLLNSEHRYKIIYRFIQSCLETGFDDIILDIIGDCDSYIIKKQDSSSSEMYIKDEYGETYFSADIPYRMYKFKSRNPQIRREFESKFEESICSRCRFNDHCLKKPSIVDEFDFCPGLGEGATVAPVYSKLSFYDNILSSSISRDYDCLIEYKA